MAVDEKWYFTKEQLLQSPSRKSGYDVDKELSCRQQAANFIQDMGQRLQVSQLCINTAIVYMHRFYVFHSLAAFHRNAIAAAALFLAAKVEEQPRKLEHVIRVAHICLHRENPNLDTKSELYLEQAQDLVFNENVLLQTLGFDVAIDHPHTHVVRCCHLVRASKDLAQTSYFMASNSLHLTTMCLQYKPTVVACFCIHLACKWSNWEIPRSKEGKDWFSYIDETVTIDLLEQLTGEFLAILDKCPTKLKRKMMSMNQNNTPGLAQQSMPHDGLQFEEPRKLSGIEAIKPPEGLFPVQKSSSQSSVEKPGTSSSSGAPPHPHHSKIDYKEYREKKERERMEREKQQQQRDGHSNVSSSNHHHHSKANVMSAKSHSNVQSRSSSGSASHKSYQQPPHGMQQNMHFQNMKENRDASSQSFQSSSSTKDSNYLKQHPPHMERDGNKDSVTFHGQYSQNMNMQHQGYPHKPESNYSGNYSHRDGSQRSHGVQISGNSNLPQAHHNQNSMKSQREFSMGNQRESSKDSESQSQSQVKDAMSSSIRDIISQSVSQKDVHSMTTERKEHVRDKSRMNYMHGSSSASNFSRSESIKSGREQMGMTNFHEPGERKIDEFGGKIKDSDIPQIKMDKPGAQCSSDMHKKLSDRAHEKHRKPQELERISHGMEGSGSMSELSKHHKMNKEMIEKHKMLIPGQHGDQRMKEKLSPSKFQKMKSVPRPSSLGYAKPESGHFSLDGNSGSNANESERSDSSNQSFMSLKPLGGEDTSKNMGNVSGFQKQKNHEFGAPGSLPNSLPDNTMMKSSKTTSIFSPDSKIPPQNILSNLEKDKKNSSSSHRSHSSNKTPPSSSSSMLASSKKTVPATVPSTITTSTTSTTGSLFSPPLPKNVPSAPPRHRTSSSGSEPELIPVLTKLEETPGYEHIVREKKIALTPTGSGSPSSDKEKKTSISSVKLESSSASLFDFDHKPSPKEIKSNDIKSSSVKSEMVSQQPGSKPVVNMKFPNEIRSDLGAVIYPTNPKSAPVPKSNQGFALSDSKLSLANSVSTVNLLGIEKMVDTRISPGKQTNQFGNSSSGKANAVPNSNFNPTSSSVNMYGSLSMTPKIDQSEKPAVDQSLSKNSNVVSNQEIIDVEGLSYLDKKRVEKKKKKEKHKHKEKDKDRSERKKEKKKHRDKDKERSKEKDKHKDKEKHKEREIDVVSSETPIKITIPKDKISGSLKIKISKDCLKKEEVAESPKSGTSGELKIKISKDVFSNISTYKEESKSDSKKRERSPKGSEMPHSKLMKTSERKSSSMKSNGTEGSSRNSSSHKYSVSVNGSLFDFSSLYDFPLDFEENGQGIIKTPDYDFEALTEASKFPQDIIHTSPETSEIGECYKSSHNESETTTKDDRDVVVTSQPKTDAASPEPTECCDVDVACGDIGTDLILKPISPLHDNDSPKRQFAQFADEGVFTPKDIVRTESSPLNVSHSKIIKDESLPKNEDGKKDKMISLENCDVLKNYKTILDSHSRRCESEILKHSVSPVSPEENATETTNNNNNDNNNNENITDDTVTSSDKNSIAKSKKNASDTENPNYYNKYFKKDGGSRMRPREDKRPAKGRSDEKNRSDDRRYYDSRRYRTEYLERERRDERRYYREYRDYAKDSQYYYERKDDRRFDYPEYSTNQYFTASKAENNMSNLNYDINSNGTPTVYQSCAQSKTSQQQFPQICDPTMTSNPPDINIQYQYGFFNNYMYGSGGYRFYGNVPFVNMSLIQQQPIPPGTGDSIVQLEPPPLPLEPPPDLPPPPETPPPPK